MATDEHFMHPVLCMAIAWYTAAARSDAVNNGERQLETYALHIRHELPKRKMASGSISA